MGNDPGRIVTGIATLGTSEAVRAIDKDAGKAMVNFNPLGRTTQAVKHISNGNVGRGVTSIATGGLNEHVRMVNEDAGRFIEENHPTGSIAQRAADTKDFGDLFSKDGVVTQIVEAVPGGGFVTAPIHKAADNDTEAALAFGGGMNTYTSIHSRSMCSS